MGVRFKRRIDSASFRNRDSQEACSEPERLRAITDLPLKRVWAMRILDIDLDIFLDNRFVDVRERHETPPQRLSDASFRPWPEPLVRRFMESACKLSQQHRKPGRFFVDHDELFLRLREEIANGSLAPGFDIVHADAHADFGIGAGTFHFVCTEWLRRPVEERARTPDGEHGRLTNGNWLLYAVACRWIRSIVYVHHPKLSSPKKIDMPIGSLVYERPADDEVELRLVPANDLRRFRDIPPISIEPTVPFKAIAIEHYVADAPFDRVYVTQSPDYTPPAADALIPVIREYIDE